MSVLLDPVFRLGDDALECHYELLFIDNTLFGGALNELKFRVERINPQPDVVGTYRVHYFTDHFEKPSGDNPTEKTFSFTFRGDKYYTLWTTFYEWLSLVRNPVTGYMMEDVNAITGASNYRVSMIDRRIDPNGYVATRAPRRYDGVFPLSVPDPEGSYSSGNPVQIPITLAYYSRKPVTGFNPV